LDRYDVLIVGAGHAGAQTAACLRQLNFSGSIALAGAELEPPYERPPLSKDYLAGEKRFEEMLLRPANFWPDRGIVLLPGQCVTRVDPVARQVETSGGLLLGYGILVWAAGGAARRLPCPGHDLRGVHCVRDRADADAMRAELPDVARVAIVGGGYIGLETAAVLRKLGRHVTVIEMQDRLLARVAGDVLAGFYAGAHRARGVDIRLRAVVAALEGEDGRVRSVRLADGERIAADMVVAGIGIVPCVQPLLDAGAAGGNGVLVDAFCRTSLADIYAVGDCAAHANRFSAGHTIRLECVQNAADQAMVAARAITGQPAAYEAVPWFWSNQYDLRLQTVGLSAGHDRQVLRGDPATQSFSVVYLRAGAIIAVDSVNAARDYVQAKKLIQANAKPDLALLGDPGVPLKTRF
jgi:3-phenylpropionate/trans-cinnamate dioxygenase ferredoxin reductase subunit